MKGFINPQNMEYSDLTSIIHKCRGVKRITLSNMKVNRSILDAIALTKVETLVLSQCELCSDKPYISLKFDKIPQSQISTIKPQLNLYNSKYKAYADLLCKKAEEDSSEIVNFENLKTVVLFDCNSCTFYFKKSYFGIQYSLLKNTESIDFNNIVLVDAKVAKDSGEAKSYTPIGCITVQNHQDPIKFIAVESQESSYYTFYPSTIRALDIGKSHGKVFQFLKRNDLLVGFDSSKMEEGLNFTQY